MTIEKPLQIGMITACYLPRTNGVTRMVSLYKEQFEALGHQVTIFTFWGSGRGRPEPGVLRTRGIPLGEGYYYSLRFHRSTQARLAEMDIVHCHHIGMGLDMARRYFRGPVVFTNHTRYDLYSQAYLGLPRWAADRLAKSIWARPINRSQAVIAPSHGMKDILKSIGVARPVKVIPNGVDLSQWYSAPQPGLRQAYGFRGADQICVYVGRLSSEKNILLLLEQFAAANRRTPELRLVLAGQGRQLGLLEKKARQAGVQDRVRFLGPLEFNEIPRLLAAADIFVSASQSEVHPLVALEAMATGLPVIAPDSAGFCEIVQSGETGLLVADPTGLAEAIGRLARDERLRRTMGRAAKRASIRFDIRSTVQQTLCLYKELLKSPAAPRC